MTVLLTSITLTALYTFDFLLFFHWNKTCWNIWKPCERKKLFYTLLSTTSHYLYYLYTLIQSLFTAQTKQWGHRVPGAFQCFQSTLQMHNFTRWPCCFRLLLLNQKALKNIGLLSVFMDYPVASGFYSLKSLLTSTASNGNFTSTHSTNMNRFRHMTGSLAKKKNTGKWESH